MIFFLTSLRGLRSEKCDQYPGQGHAELQELSFCSLSQHRKGKVSYCDLYPVIVLTHSQGIYMSAHLLRGSMSVRSAQHRYNISAEAKGHLLLDKSWKPKGKGGKSQVCTNYALLNHCCPKK